MSAPVESKFEYYYSALVAATGHADRHQPARALCFQVKERASSRWQLECVRRTFARTSVNEPFGSRCGLERLCGVRRRGGTRISRAEGPLFFPCALRHTWCWLFRVCRLRCVRHRSSTIHIVQ